MSAEPVPVTNAETVAETPVPEITPEAAILSPDPVVVESNLAKAEPVQAPTEAEATPAETTETAGETAPVTEAPVATEPTAKEGSAIMTFLKKHIPNPKIGEKKAPAAAKTAETKTEGEEVAVSDAPAPVEPVEEQPFEGGDVNFKTHGGIFG
jgi:hypothetical protein